MSYILAIDQGTTSSRAFLVDAEARIIASAQQDFAQHYPNPGWVEHNPEEIWSTVCTTIEQVVNQANVGPGDIAGIGITNQRETTVVWDRDTGKPIHHAIVWQCRRTADVCTQLKERGFESVIRSKTGLVLDPYFSGTKIAWILDHVDGARDLAMQGKLAFGTIDSFLIYRLSGGHAHITDASNASRTLLMDIHKTGWDPELCDILGVPMSMLPEIVDSSGVLAKCSGMTGIADGTVISGIAGDQQAALFGQACFEAGQAKCTYGTGSFILMNTGDRVVHSEGGLLSTVAWKIGATTTYALEGASFIAGAAVQWLRDGLGMIQSAADIEALAQSVETSEGVTFVPAFAGLGAPHWRPDARGVIHGLTRGTTKAHIARAALEGIALQQCELLDLMVQESGVTLQMLRVDGGAAENDLLMQIQSDLLDVTLVRPAQTETTVMGAAFLAGLGVGLWESMETIAQHWQHERQFTAQLASDSRQALRTQWSDIVARA